MQLIPTLLSTTVLLGGTAAGILSLDSSAARPQDPRDAVLATKIELREAIRIALDARPGTAVEAELESTGDEHEEAEEHEEGEEHEHEGGQLVYEIVILAGDELYEVTVDPQSGKVLGNEEDDDAEEEEVAEFRRVLRHTEKSLAELVGAAQEVIHGKAVTAKLEIDDGQPVCEVVLAHSRYLIEVDVEGRAGHIVDLELYDELGGEEGEHHGRGGDEDDDEEAEEDEEHEHPHGHRGEGDDDDDDDDDDGR
ncbi:MAG: PepSY domain-containing protein [Planctomycetes bacterium]|nr:PepSY domain-containing protein [Planctomycetota bacterium]